MIGGRSPFAEAGTVGVAGGKIPQPAASGEVAPRFYSAVEQAVAVYAGDGV
jgi:hypothetical protein